LGVKPRQFGALLAVLSVSVVGLGLKAMAGSRQAAAAVPEVPAAAVEPARAEKVAPRSGNPVKPCGDASGARRVIECSLERVPARDPFHAWGVPEPVATAAPVARPVSGSEPGLLPGLPLRAVLRGELAVFGDQTVRPGESVSLPDGSFARVRIIGDRSVAVEWNGRNVDVMFGIGVASGDKAPSAGGFK
jgi:hypothetical protein